MTQPSRTYWNRDQIQGALRISWSHLTGPVDWQAVATRITGLR